MLSFVAGPATPLVSWNMETDPGWTVGAPGDDATAGIWARVHSIQSANYDTANFIVIQPGGDHTPGDTLCWITGNAPAMFVPGYNDVDDGRTTLTTARFDAAAAGTEHPIVDYWRWYSNNTGTATDDVFAVDISNDDGATWVPFERLGVTANSWERVLGRIEDFVTPTHTMRMRFVASDLNESSIVEAAIDDFRLLAFPAGSVAVEPAMARAALALSPPRPNPSAGPTRLGFTLRSAARVRLEIYDIGGRRVRGLLEAPLGAGAHEVEWDGRDDAGRPAAGGLYFARLDAGGEQRVQRIVRAR